MYHGFVFCAIIIAPLCPFVNTYLQNFFKKVWLDVDFWKKLWGNLEEVLPASGYLVQAAPAWVYCSNLSLSLTCWACISGYRIWTREGCKIYSYGFLKSGNFGQLVCNFGEYLAVVIWMLVTFVFYVSKPLVSQHLFFILRWKKVEVFEIDVWSWCSDTMTLTGSSEFFAARSGCPLLGSTWCITKFLHNYFFWRKRLLASEIVMSKFSRCLASFWAPSCGGICW